MQRAFLRSAPPHGRFGWLTPRRVARLARFVLAIAPSDGDGQRVRFLEHEEAEPHGRRKQTPLRRLALLGGLFRQASVVRHRIQIIVFVRVGALFERGVRRHEEGR